MFNQWELPSEIELDGVILRLNTDYRDILQIISIYQNPKYSPYIKMMACLQIFIDNYDDITDGSKALNILMEFIACGEQNKDEGGNHKLIDWEQDYLPLVGDINKVAGTDVRSLSYLHWFTFVSYYMGIGEGQTSHLVHIRNKIRKGEKLTKDEREYVRNNKNKVNLKQDSVDDEEKKRLKERFG